MCMIQTLETPLLQIPGGPELLIILLILMVAVVGLALVVGVLVLLIALFFGVGILA